jgi:beta-N-acetylhexosaminidase
MKTESRNCILGCAGTVLTAEEAAFFRDVRPWGFILFKRNIDTPQQVKALTAALRETVGRPDAPILIDQEGGRVARLTPPHWRRYPAGRAYLEAARGDLFEAQRLVRLGARLIAHDLNQLGINTDCVPVLDVPTKGAHDIIGDRAYGDTPEIVSALGRSAAEGLTAGGVLPVIKHVPGHGRAMADSHLDLPVVEARYEELDRHDFEPFRALSDMPMAMTAHVVFTAVDKVHPLTHSKKGISKVVRQALGFDGLLMSDDLSMKALKGSFRARAEAALEAGCDVVLHCNGDMGEMRGVAEACQLLHGAAKRRAEAALQRIPRRIEPFDAFEARRRFEEAMGKHLPA